MTTLRALFVVMAVGGVAGALAAPLVGLRGLSLPLAEVFSTAFAGLLMIGGALAGAFLGLSAWVLIKPPGVPRASVVAACVNAGVWLSFVLFAPVIDGAEIYRIAAVRAARDADPSGIEWVHDVPILVAGRWHGTIGGINFADGLLSFAAAPAIGFARAVVVPPRYVGTNQTEGESYAIAALAFVLSTAFWGVVAAGGSALQRWISGRPSSQAG